MGDRHYDRRPPPRHWIGELFILALLVIALAPAFFLASALAVSLVRQLIFRQVETIGPVLLTLIAVFTCYATYASVRFLGSKMEGRPPGLIAVIGIISAFTICGAWVLTTFTIESVRVGAPPQPEPEKLPEFPVWWPPTASASYVLPDEFIHRQKDFGSVSATILVALRKAGYYAYSYFAIPGGFALVTQIERIEENGDPDPEPARWNADIRYHGWTFASIMKGLFFAPEGRFRILVFAVTNVGFQQHRYPDMTAKYAMTWQGLNVLPWDVVQQQVSDDYHCTVLVYEFEGRGYNAESHLVIPSSLLGRAHLEKSGLLALLGG